ncbi:PhzF family phenazine biosynthesis protein [Cereibacter johrii]|uniref:PhzF family phenazine biosynthesis protein n=1 Tax=Cereibacter johrii TaxID=445629 RepID=UPI000DCD2358|nr:PhzF family phenazine biosynthesis protein [Cereibacter johrii]RAZ86909.1 PhzF family phenazine biosynthesis protein [Cereibacter johrii]
MKKRILQIDAFSDRPLLGNPAAVVFDADDLPTGIMQRVAREMNLSETVFLLRPTGDADYRARIFTPVRELPFAGHPTIAAAHAFCGEQGRTPRNLTQECGIGLVPIRIEGGLYTMTQATPQFRDVPVPKADLAEAICLPLDRLTDSPHQIVSTGVPWLLLELHGLRALADLRPDLGRIERICHGIGAAGLTVFADRGTGATPRLRLRTFAPGEGVAEDPVCGSGNGALAAWIATHLDPVSRGGYLAEQGVDMGRRGQVHAGWERTADGLRITVGGAACIVLRGELDLGDAS